MTTAEIAKSAAPITSANATICNSNKCVICLDLHPQSTSVHMDRGWEWLNSTFWVGELGDVVDVDNPGSESFAVIWAGGVSVRDREQLIRDLKVKVRTLGHTRCEVIGDQGEVISDGALRQVRPSAKANIL